MEPPLEESAVGKKRKWTYAYATKDGKQVRLHRWLMEQAIGRKLRPEEHVHHIDGDTLNNAIENLVVLVRSRHVELHQDQKRTRMRTTPVFAKGESYAGAGIVVTRGKPTKGLGDIEPLAVMQKKFRKKRSLDKKRYMAGG